MTSKSSPNYSNENGQKNQDLESTPSSVKCDSFAHCFLGSNDVNNEYVKQFDSNDRNYGKTNHDNAAAHTSLLV